MDIEGGIWEGGAPRPQLTNSDNNKSRVAVYVLPWRSMCITIAVGQMQDHLLSHSPNASKGDACMSNMHPSVIGELFCPSSWKVYTGH